MSADDPQFGVADAAAETSIKEHIPKRRTTPSPSSAQGRCGRADKLGETVERLKKIVPTHPHPMAPDHPPFNALLGPGAGLVDRLRDMLTGRGKQ